MKRISIITCGPGIDEVKSMYGQASDWIQKKLSSYNIDLRIIKGYEKGELDSSIDDAWIITGSAHSVYEDLEWISYLSEQLHVMEEANKPVLGICFGHQLIAHTFGGKVERNHLGWELGSCTISLTKDSENSILFKDIISPLDVYQSHQDVVSKLPPNAMLMAKNSMGIQSFVYNNNFFGVQFHPEFTYDVMRKYLEIRYRKGIIDRIPDVNKSEKSTKILNNFVEHIVNVR